MIGMYYKRYEMQKRFTVYNTSVIIAGAFGGVSYHSIPWPGTAWHGSQYIKGIKSSSHRQTMIECFHASSTVKNFIVYSRIMVPRIPQPVKLHHVINSH